VVLTRGFVNRTTLFPIHPAFSITQQMLSGVMKSWQGCVLKSIAFLFQSAPFYLYISGLFNPRLCSPRISAHIALSVRRPYHVYKPEIKSGWKRTGNIRITWHRAVSVQLFLQWKSNKYYVLWVCVCSLSCPACNAHASSCHLWPVWLLQYFSISYKRHDFRKYSWQ
jgi:hypothetical protein